MKDKIPQLSLMADYTEFEYLSHDQAGAFAKCQRKVSTAEWHPPVT